MEIWKKEWNIMLSEVPAAELANITRGGLKPYWHKAPGQERTIAPCVNCGRTVQIRPYGLCGSCERATNKLRGPAMLDALVAARARLQNSDRALRAQNRKMAERGALNADGGPKAETAARPIISNPKSEIRDEVILISPLAGLGERYIRLGEMMRDVRTSLGDLAAAAHELGLRLEINVGVEK